MIRLVQGRRHFGFAREIVQSAFGIGLLLLLSISIEAQATKIGAGRVWTAYHDSSRSPTQQRGGQGLHAEAAALSSC